MPKARLTRALVTLLFATLASSCREPEKKKRIGEPCHSGECGLSLVCEGSAQPVCQLCESTPGCRARGECSFIDGECQPAGDWDCAGSVACAKESKCWAGRGGCTSVRPLQPNQDPDNKEGGCPCGCDHSTEMVAELREHSPSEALATARRSLHAIGEREQLGYVTDAMVSHRLRLRELEKSVMGEGDAPFSSELTPRALALRAERAALPVRSAHGLTVQSELLVYGATTDRVHGKPKPLQACFRVWLGLESANDQPRVLELPRVAGSTKFDVRRWYVEDTDGQPWDGKLAPGERRSVLLIGYVDEPIAPGTVVDATLAVGDVEIALRSTALSSWDAHGRE